MKSLTQYINESKDSLKSKIKDTIKGLDDLNQIVSAVNNQFNIHCAYGEYDDHYAVYGTINETPFEIHGKLKNEGTTFKVSKIWTDE